MRANLHVSRESSDFANPSSAFPSTHYTAPVTQYTYPSNNRDLLKPPQKFLVGNVFENHHLLNTSAFGEDRW